MLLFTYSCATNNIKTTQKEKIISAEVFSNKGFTLLFSDDLRKNKIINKKIESRSLIVFQKNLKKNTTVKITNLLNNKSILAKVGTNSKYPNFYNSVVSKRIFEELQLNEYEPYIEIIEIRGAGLLLGIKTKSNNIEINKLFTKNGLLCVPADDNVIRLAPPLIITETEVDEAIQIIEKTLKGF